MTSETAIIKGKGIDALVSEYSPQKVEEERRASFSDKTNDQTKSLLGLYAPLVTSFLPLTFSSCV